MKNLTKLHPSTPPQADEVAWRRSLDPVQKWITKHRRDGAIAVLVEQLNIITRGAPCYVRQQIESYFYEDSGRRREPRLGVGLLLLTAWTTISGDPALRACKRKDVP